MLRLLHTADWHLGHTLHDVSRDYEHARFLDWLVDTAVAQSIDALLICGDVFETIHPPATAFTALYRTFAKLKRELPELTVVVIGGNHDSPARLEVATDLLTPLGVHVVGAVTRRADRAGLDIDRLCVPIRDRSGSVRAWCAAVPYLRPQDLPIPVDALTDDTSPASDPSTAAATDDPWIAGVRAVYDEVLDTLRARREPQQALLALGHAYLVGTQLSELSERRILGGNQHALPVDLFGDDIAYTALGHLHRAQCVGGRDDVRYSGSPIPLSMAEIDYPHQVVMVAIDGPRCVEITPLRVPRAVPFLRVPETGPAVLDEVLVRLAALPELDPQADDRLRPLLQVDVLLDVPEPDLRQRLELALDGRSPRLVKVAVTTLGDRRTLDATSPPDSELADLDPKEVFYERWRSEHGSEPDAEVLAEFDALLESVLTYDVESQRSADMEPRA